MIGSASAVLAVAAVGWKEGEEPAVVALQELQQRQGRHLRLV